MHQAFKRPDEAGWFFREHREFRDLLRPRHCHNQVISAAFCRFRFTKGTRLALDIMVSA